MSDAAPWEDFAPTDTASDASSAPPADDSGPWSDFADVPPANTSSPNSSDTPFQDAWGQAKHQLGQATKWIANAVAAAPLMAMDAGVATRNIVGDAYNKVTGQPPTPDYDLPSTIWHQGMNDIFGAPRNNIEKVADVVMPAVAGGMAAAENAPAVLRSAMGPAEIDNAAPSAFVNPADQKRQILAQTIQNGQKLGLVVPPQTTNPNLLNWTAETIGGKIATQQAASVRNQPIANAVASRELGLNPDAPLTPGAVRSVISDAGQGYQALRNVGQVNTDDQFIDAISDVAAKAAGPAKSFPGSKVSPLIDETDSLLQPSFDASDAVDKIAQLRDSSSMAYRAGDTQLGAGYRQLSNALENQIDRSISTNPNIDPSVVQNFRASRVMAAKAHSVLDALNPSTGDVSIRSLADSQDPLSGDLKTLADFGRAAPRATQDVAKIGSHGVSHLDVLGPTIAGFVGEHAAGPWGMAAAAGYPASRWGARAYALGPGQGGAIPSVESGATSPKTVGSLPALIQGSTNAPDDTTGRATGGKVDHEALVTGLYNRWKSAKRDTDKSTKPLLNVPDASIIKALDIAQAHL